MSNSIKLIFTYPNKKPFKKVIPNKSLSNSKLRVISDINPNINIKLTKYKVYINNNDITVKCNIRLNNHI
jgi:hypothetical protein